MTEAVDLSVRASGFLQGALVFARTQHAIEVVLPVSAAEFLQRRCTTDWPTRFGSFPEAGWDGRWLWMVQVENADYVQVWLSTQPTGRKQ
jgi:hypothetical protein